MSRATYLTQSGVRLLDDWGVCVARMFRPETPYLVGSALLRSDYRDVDVRVMLSDESFELLAGVVDLADLNLSVSLWGQQVTGLPVDFQVQCTSAANAQWQGRRHPLGLRPQGAA